MKSLRIDERAWSNASAERRKEWRTLIREVPVDDLWPSHGWREMHLAFDETAIRIELFLSEGGREAVAIEREALASVLTEYLTVIARLEEEGLSTARAEVLDMAKKVVHDDGARRLGTLVPALSPVHDVRRRFFSLLVSVAVDTSKLPDDGLA